MEPLFIIRDGGWMGWGVRVKVKVMDADETFVCEGVEDGMTTKQVECPYDRARPVKATTVGGEAREPGAVWLMKAE
ncbi:hypothetical protein LB505_001415 [Fusarium chuoi]|nr:hypothetical protein LB505_001415 [Fusarium chuoi]